MGQAYKEVNPEVFNQNTDAARSRRSGGGGDYWKPAVGKTGSPVKNVIRMLPPHVNMADVIIEGKMHFNLGPDGKSAATCLGPFGEECPACSLVDQLYKDAKSERDPAAAAVLKKKASDQAAKLRFFANIVDMAKPELGVQPYPFGPDVEKKIRNCFYEDDDVVLEDGRKVPKFRDISHPKRGRDIIMNVQKKSGTDFNEYEVRAKESPSVLFDMDLLDKIRDMSEYTKKPSRQDVLNAISGTKAVKPAAAQAPTPGRPVGRPAVATAAVMAEATAPTAPPLTRTPVSAESVTNGGDPYAAARRAIAALGFMSPAEITPEEAEVEKKPKCYSKLTEPKDQMCQGCRVLLPCYTALHKL